MSKEKLIIKGDKVFVEDHGSGIVEAVSQANSPDGAYQIYHVRLENDEVRHFTAEQVELD